MRVDGDAPKGAFPCFTPVFTWIVETHSPHDGSVLIFHFQHLVYIWAGSFT